MCWKCRSGFKWFVEGTAGRLDWGFGGGGKRRRFCFLRRDGTAWTTDKDGIIMCLLAAEITARTGKDPGYHPLPGDGRAPGAGPYYTLKG